MNQTDSFGRRAGRAFTRALVMLLVLGLFGAVGVLLSQLNARTLSLEIRGDQLVVLKGRMFPFGADPLQPSDPALADAYAPLPLEGTTPTQVQGRSFNDRDELDRALFEVIEGLARSRVRSDDPKVLDRGLYYLRRGDRLAGLTAEQRLSLKSMQADVAYYLARTRLEDAQKQIAEALAQLRIAAQSDNRHARSANQMLLTVEPAVQALEESLRRAVHSLSSPAGELPPPAPALPAAPEPDAGVGP